MAATSIKYLQINFKHKNPSSRARKRVDCKILSMKMDGGYNDYVDRSLIVLRKRIHEVKMKEEEHAPPSSWWRWEKEWHKLYGGDVIEIVGLLQIWVMNERPSLVLATGALFLICVLVAVYVVMCNLVSIVGLVIL